MTKMKATAMAFLLAGAATLSAQDISWERLYGYAGYDQSFDVAVTSDGGYIMAGHIDSYGVDDVWVLRTDAAGDTLWTKQYGSPDLDEQVFDVDTTSDGGFLLTGYIGVDYQVANDVWVLKLDSNGDTIWTYVHDEGYYDRGLCAVEAPDGGYLISGHVGSVSNHTVLLLKLTSAGVLESSASFTGPYPATAGYDICQTTDGGYVVAGETGTEGTPDLYDVYAIKFGADLDSAWAVSYGTAPLVDRGFATAASDDGGCLIAGYVDSPPSGAGVFWVLRLDSAGDTLWTRRFPGETGETSGYAVLSTQGGGCLAGGWHGSVADVDLYFIELDPDGDTLWTMTHGGAGYDFVHGLALIEDTSYVATGYSTSGSAGGYDCYLLGLEKPRFTFFTPGDADGNTIVNISDAVYLITYIFGGGDPPEPLLAGDCDCNEIVNISDAVYLISYIFGGGPEPGEDCP